MRIPLFCLAIAFVLPNLLAGEREDFRVLPYLQNPNADSITIRWLSEKKEPGELEVAATGFSKTWTSEPAEVPQLAYNPFGAEPADRHQTLPWLHSVRVSALSADKQYDYTVRQSGSDFRGVFRTAPDGDRSIRFIVFADPETEPESSTSDPVDWPVPQNSNRPVGMTKYLANQTVGYRENLRIIAERKPDFVCITGDLVESGGEQRDWDEFWRHIAGDYGKLATNTPIFPAIGNHENFGGPGDFGGYSAQAADFGVGKYLTYFDLPSNGVANPKHVERYYSTVYGPIALITVDSSDGLPHLTTADTNHNLSGSSAPDFNPGSEQFRWLEGELAKAQTRSRFTFVQFHHTAYGSGPHSVPLGTEGFSGQSGIAMRVLQPLLFRYGVDAVFSGHDEMLERSLVYGQELLPNGETRVHKIHFFDAGIAGDGLRGPTPKFDNLYRKFLAHDDWPEVWDGRRLVSGGKHYGHLEVNVFQSEAKSWSVRIEPVHAFPLTDSDGRITGWERRVIADVVEIH